MGDDAVTYTWATREVPILQAVLRRVDGGEMNPTLEDIRSEVGLDVGQMQVALDALEHADPPYLELMTAGGSTPDYISGSVLRVLERTRRELGAWPSAEGLLAKLTEALAEEVDAEKEPERKVRLRAALDVLTGTANKVVVDVFSGYVERRLP
jgi:hypothetical protein